MTDEKVSSQETDPAQWIESHGDALYRYALMRLKDPHRAEDVVQETLLAAWRARDKFAEKSSERTWLTGILRHKITDCLRKQFREATVSDVNGEAEVVESFFRRDGVWREKPRSWRGTPEHALEQDEFWVIFHRCLTGLPRRLAEAFKLREFDACDTEHICDILGISTTNLSTILHRARLSLRKCLELRWFGKRREKT